MTLCLGGTTASFAGSVTWINYVPAPTPVADVPLSDAARALIAQAWEGLDPARVVDVHAHVIGLGAGGTGCQVHPGNLSWTSPLRLVKTRFYKGAAGIYDESKADALYLERLLDLAQTQTPRARLLLLAFDHFHDAAGEPRPEVSEFYTPNDYVAGIVEAHPELFLFCCSVHPYRKDALAELDRCVELGAKCVKWLPNAMGIDPLDPRCLPFYERMAAHGLPLLTHAGEEQAVHAEEAQALGNPLRLRAPLAQGVTVLLAHCASLGTNEDLDQEPAADGSRPRESGFELFRRLVKEPREAGRLFADISATPQFNRCDPVLAELLGDPALHPFLINGSDYPLPAIDLIIRTGQLAGLGLLDPAEVPLLEEVFAANPLLFDFVLKRRLRRITEAGEQRFPSSVFETAHLFEG
ncbi:MAG: amidohydrolase family protein [Planctomycetes bacterium]|nr:amidohydrolase family protein [Planctomycetota bacterium]